MNNIPIIFYGTGRSGSSMISEIIFQHPDIAFPSNFHQRFPRYFPNNFYRYIFDNKYWRITGKKFQIGYNEVSLLNKFLFIPSEAWNLWKILLPGELNFERSFLFNRKANLELQDDVRKYFQIMLEQQGRKRLGIKITGPPRMVFLNSIFVNPLFIHVKRCIIPTIYSFLNTPFWRKQGMYKLWWNDIYTEDELYLVSQNCKNAVWMTAFQLKKILDITALEKEIIPINQGEILYEKFVTNPEFEIESLLGFAGLTFHNDCFKFLKKLNIRNDLKPDTFYFSKRDLDTIYSIIGFKN